MKIGGLRYGMKTSQTMNINIQGHTPRLGRSRGVESRRARCLEGQLEVELHKPHITVLIDEIESGNRGIAIILISSLVSMHSAVTNNYVLNPIPSFPMPPGISHILSPHSAARLSTHYQDHVGQQQCYSD